MIIEGDDVAQPDDVIALSVAGGRSGRLDVMAERGDIVMPTWSRPEGTKAVKPAVSVWRR